MDFDTIRFIDEAFEDLKRLDRGIQLKAIKKLKQLDKNHLLGKQLGNIGNRDLSGCYKVYFYDNKYRIVYKLLKGEIQISCIEQINSEEDIAKLETVKIYGIGKRDKFEVYDNVYKRIIQELSDTENIK